MTICEWITRRASYGETKADVLSTLQTMWEYGFNLICVEDGIDSSKDVEKLIFSDS